MAERACIAPRGMAMRSARMAAEAREPAARARTSFEAYMVDCICDGGRVRYVCVVRCVRSTNSYCK